MANRKTHVLAGFVSGVAAAGYSARYQEPEHLLLEATGGGIGGMLGGAAPDVLDPAIHSWHRSVAHSGAGGLTVAIAARQLPHGKNTAGWKLVVMNNCGLLQKMAGRGFGTP